MRIGRTQMYCSRISKIAVFAIAALAVAGPLSAATSSRAALTRVVAAPPAAPQTATACTSNSCEAPGTFACTDLGFKIELKSFTPATTSNSGVNTYVYEICNPPLGTCSLDSSHTCDGNSQCGVHGPNDWGVCNRECVVDQFHDLSHFDVSFTSLSACTNANTFISGSCSCTGTGCSVGNFVQSDGSCNHSDVVYKCDSAGIGTAGQCIQMTVNISGETAGLGLGEVQLIDKAGNECTRLCVAGPTCNPQEDCGDNVDNDCDTLADCDDPDCPCDQGRECLTRTLGFWGTHPWITNNYTPVTVGSLSLTCDGAANDTANPSCVIGTCNDVMEALGSNSSEVKKSSNYISLLRQLTAAQLNLKATAALFPGGACSAWSYGGFSIGEWIARCEAYIPGGTENVIGASGCIAALDDFNNSYDVVDSSTPLPFASPQLDDSGNVSGADSSAFTGAGHSGVVPGKLCPNVWNQPPKLIRPAIQRAGEN